LNIRYPITSAADSSGQSDALRFAPQNAHRSGSSALSHAHRPRPIS
jgi:hypothetical protein